MRTISKLPIVVLVCLLCSFPAFALGSSEIAGDDYETQLPVSVSDSAGGSDEPVVNSSEPDEQTTEPVVQVTEPDVEISEPVPQVTVTDADEPVSVEQTQDDQQIVLNVTITPPNVDVKTESPTVSVAAPVVTVENPVAPVADYSTQSVSGDMESDEDDEPEPEPAFIPFSWLSLDSSSDDDSIEDTVRAVMVNLFGEYRPRTQTVTQILADGSEVTYQEYVPGLAGLDVPWLASVVVFMLMLFCLFRLLGGVLSRG